MSHLLLICEFTLIIKALPHICPKVPYFAILNGDNMMPGGPVGLSEDISVCSAKKR